MSHTSYSALYVTLLFTSFFLLIPVFYAFLIHFLFFSLLLHCQRHLIGTIKEHVKNSCSYFFLFCSLYILTAHQVQDSNSVKQLQYIHLFSLLIKTLQKKQTLKSHQCCISHERKINSYVGESAKFRPLCGKNFCFRF